jgi:hypothetical protein
VSGSIKVIVATRGSRLTANERWVLTCIALRESVSSGCWASMTTLADDTGLGERTVYRVVASLVASGVLFAEARPGRTTVYRTRPKAIATPVTLAGVATPVTVADPPVTVADPPVTVADDPSLDPSSDPVGPPSPRKRGDWNRELEAFVTRHVAAQLDRLTTEPTVDDLGVPLHLVDEDTIPDLLDEVKVKRRAQLAEVVTLFERAPPALVAALVAAPGCPTRRKRGVDCLVRAAVARWRSTQPPLLRVHHQLEATG